MAFDIMDGLKAVGRLGGDLRIHAKLVGMRKLYLLPDHGALFGVRHLKWVPIEKEPII